MQCYAILCNDMQCLGNVYGIPMQSMDTYEYLWISMNISAVICGNMHWYSIICNDMQYHVMICNNIQ